MRAFKITGLLALSVLLMFTACAKEPENIKVAILAPLSGPVPTFGVMTRDGALLAIEELHVNGRPVRRMALLRAGDAVFVDGHEWLLLGDTPPSAPVDTNTPANETQADPRVVLRGVGGLHHGRCITLDRPRVVGRLPDCDVRISDAAFADRHARLDPHPEGAVLRDLGSHEGSVVNGWPVHHGLLRPGDQVVFDSQRFVVEAPRADCTAAREQDGQRPPSEPESSPPVPDERKLPSSARRMPWLLLAALFLATSLSLLLLYGAR